MFDVKHYGAVGDGVTVDSAAISRTVQACSHSGGGTVVFPAGRYLTGPIQLLSDVTMHLEAGATLIASPHVDDYFEVQAAVESARVGLLYATHAANITISGQGCIDLNGTAFMNMQALHIVRDLDRSYTRQKENYLPANGEIADGPVDYLDRPGDSLQFLHCTHVTLRDITLLNAPDWTVRFGNCDNILVSGISLLNNLLISNSDGIHLTSCRNVRIADCHIEAGDDAIAITGYGALDQLSANITVCNSTLLSRSAGIRVGIVGNIENCIFQNLVIHANRGIGIFVRQEESIKNLLFSDLIIHTRLHTGNWWGKGEPIHISVLRHGHPAQLGSIRSIHFRNILSESESGIVVYGSAESKIEDLSFEHMSLTISPSPLNATYGGNFDLRPSDDVALALFAHDECGLYAHCVKGLYLHDFKLRWQGEAASYFTNGIRCEQSEAITIDGFSGRQASLAREEAVIALDTIYDVTIRNCTATEGSGTFLEFNELRAPKLFTGNDLTHARTLARTEDIPFVQYGNILPEQSSAQH